MSKHFSTIVIRSPYFHVPLTSFPTGATAVCRRRVNPCDMKNTCSFRRIHKTGAPNTRDAPANTFMNATSGETAAEPIAINSCRDGGGHESTAPRAPCWSEAGLGTARAGQGARQQTPRHHSAGHIGRRARISRRHRPRAKRTFRRFLAS